jgi:threonine dehydrogenase-like Zn-dependent dehydrogenase
VSQSSFQKGDDVLVVGAGPVGLAVIQILKARGAGKILASELSSRRQELALHFGADHILDPRMPDTVQVCKAACGGEGPAVVFDAAGVQSGLDLAMAASRTGATIVNIASWKTQPQINSLALIMGEKKYIGTMVYLKDDFELVIEAMGSGTWNSADLTTAEPFHADIHCQELFDRRR